MLPVKIIGRGESRGVNGMGGNSKGGKSRGADSRGENSKYGWR